MDAAARACRRIAPLWPLANFVAVNPFLGLLDRTFADSALDVSIQAQIINLLLDLQAERGLTYPFISHDMAVVRHISTRVAVMYLGRLAELAPTAAIFAGARHSYTRALMAATPTVGRKLTSADILGGEVPDPIDPPRGCRLHPRCPMAIPRCAEEVPAWRRIAPDHWVACHRAEPTEPDAAGQDRPATRLAGEGSTGGLAPPVTAGQPFSVRDDLGQGAGTTALRAPAGWPRYSTSGGRSRFGRRFRSLLT